MVISDGNIIRLAWAVVLGYWLITGRFTRRRDRGEGFAARLFKYTLPLVMAILLIGPGGWFQSHWLHRHLWPQSDWLVHVGVMVVLAGAILALWARTILGRNWSSVVELKQSHQLIQAGPYRWIRHPIYTALLLMFAGTAIAIGEVRGLLAVLIVFVSFWVKWRLEERWLTERFGGRYLDYMKRTGALLPRWFDAAGGSKSS